MTNAQLFDSHMYIEVIRQYEEVAEFINLDSNIRERLKHPQRHLLLHFRLDEMSMKRLKQLLGIEFNMFFLWVQQKVALGTLQMST